MEEVKTKIICKDPNTLFENKTVKQEELTKYVNLSVRTKERFAANAANNMSYTSFNSGDYTYVSNASTDGPYQSTSYVDISFTDNKLGAVRNRELFGVDSIDISFDAQLFPVVTMGFTDIRGHFLTQMSNKHVANEIIEETERQIAKDEDGRKTKYLNDVINSQKAIATSKIFFETLFQFPYPVFTLTVKGYYGPVVRFNLSVSDFKSRFDSTTGNFKIIVSFIGNLYGCLSEIPASYVLTSPYFDSKVLWNVESKNFKFDDGDEIPDIMTFLSRYEKLISGKSDNNLNLETTNISAYSNMLKKKNAYEKLKMVLESYDDDIHSKYKHSDTDTISPKEQLKLIKSVNNEIINNHFYIKEPIDGSKKTKIIDILDGEFSKYFDENLKNNIKNLIAKNSSERIYILYFCYKNGVYNLVRKNLVIEGGKSIDDAKKIKNNYKKIRQRYRKYENLKVDNYNDGNCLLEYSSNGLNISAVESIINNNTFEEKKLGEGFYKNKENNVEFIKQFNIFRKISDIGDVYVVNDNEKYDILFLYFYEDTYNYIREVEKEIDRIEKDELKNLRERAEEETKTLCRSVLGFNPTLKNIYHMIFAHLNVLVKQINKNVVNEINSRTYNRGWGEYYFSGYTTDVSNPYDIVPPFPLVANSRDGKVIFPNVIEKFKNEPEVRFVENLVNNLQQYSYLLKDEFYEINKSDGEISVNTDWYPQFPSDIVYGKNPYDVAFKDLSLINSNKICENIIKIFALRMRNNMLFGCIPNNDFIKNEIINISHSTPHKQNKNTLKVLKDDFKSKLSSSFGKMMMQDNNDDYEVNGLFTGHSTFNQFETLLYIEEAMGEYEKLINEKRYIKVENRYCNSEYSKTFKNTIFHISKENVGKFQNKLQNIGFDNENLCEFDNEIISNGYKFNKWEERYIQTNDYDGGRSGRLVSVKTCISDEKDNFFNLKNNSELSEKDYRAFQFYLDYRTIEFECCEGENEKKKDRGVITYITNGLSFNKDNKTRLYKITLYDILKTGCYLYCKNRLTNTNEVVGNEFVYGNIKKSLYITKFNIEERYQNFFLETFKEWIKDDNEKTIKLLGENVYSYNYYYEEDSNGKRIKPIKDSFNIDEGTSEYDPLTKTVYIGIINENYFCEKDRTRKYRPSDNLTNAKINKNNLFSTIKKCLEDNGATYEESAKEIKNNSEVTLEEKTNVYYSIKNFFDKWLCGETDNELKIFNVIKENDEKNKNEGIFHNIKFFDNHLNDISNEFYPNLKGVVNLLEKHLTEPSSSVIELLSDIAQDNDSLFLTLPTPMRQIKHDEEFNDMFLPKTWSSGETESNTFVVMKSGEASHHLADNDSNFADDGVDLVNDYTGASINGEVVAFEIKYGYMNQNYFKSIDVNMDSPTMTDESIANLLNLSQAGKDGIVSRAYTMKNSLFPVYANRSYNCTVNMMGDMAIMPLMYFQLSNVPMFRGVYLITNVKHKITPQDFTTTFTGTRVSRFTPPSSKTPILLENLLEKYGEDAEYTKPNENVSNENSSNVTINNGDINEIKSFLDLLYKNKLNGSQYNINDDVGNKREILASLSSNYLRIIGDSEKNTEEIRNGILKTYNSGGCKDNIIKLLYDIYKCVCEYNKLANGENEKPIHIFITSSRRNGSGKSQHNIGEAIDIQGSYNGIERNNDATLKLFALVHTYKKRIDQLIWENNTNDNNTYKPRIVHFSSKFWKRRSIFQAYVKNGKTTTIKDSKKQSNLFKYIVNEYKYEKN